MSTEPLVVQFVAPGSLRPDPGNPRRISEAMDVALERSIRSEGILQPLIARLADRMLVAGHQRQRIAIRLGLPTVPVIFIEASEERARTIGIALNRISGEFDEAMLARRLAELDAEADIDATLTGFGQDDIKALLRSVEAREKREQPEDFDHDAALAEATREPRAKLGDLWRLGEHRLLCGDARSPSDIERALDGRRAAAGFADAPYNVNLGNHGGRGRGRRRTMANDALEPSEFEAFTRAWTAVFLESVDGALYVCMSSKEWPTVSRILGEVGGTWSDTIIYAKDRFVLGRADYQHGYEPMWYGARQGVKRRWFGGRDQSDVWQIARPWASPLHPSTKPLELIERAIFNSSAPGDIVLDPFLGSGTTIIACERTGRLGAGVELDPIYVDIAIRRWERFTHQTATLVGRSGAER